MLLNNKLVREICDDDSGYPYLADARKKLIELRKINQPHLTKTYMVDGFTIRVEKHEVVDNIFISGDKPIWMSFADTGLYGPVDLSTGYFTNVYQLSLASAPKKEWKELPKNNNYGTVAFTPNQLVIEDGLFYSENVVRPLKLNLGNLSYFQSSGDGRYTNRSGTNLGWFKGKKGLPAGFGIPPTTAAYPNPLDPFFVDTKPNGNTQLMWRKSANRNNTIVLQGATYSIAYNSTKYPSAGVANGFNRRPALIQQFDVDYPAYIQPTNGSAPYNKNSTIDQQVTGAFTAGSDISYNPVATYLTPYNIICTRIQGDYSGYANAGVNRYIGTSTDGGYTWAMRVPSWGLISGGLGPFESGPNTATFGVPSYVALNSTTALRLSLFTFVKGNVDPNAGPITPDDAGWSVHKLGMDGSDVLLHRFTDPAIRIMEIYALGRNCYVIRALFVFADNTSSYQFSRSYDSGASWDAFTTTGWEALNYNSVSQGNSGGPRTVCGLLYPRNAITDTDPGRVFIMTIKIIPNPNAAPYGYSDVAVAASQLFVSTDQCRTFQYVADVAKKLYTYGSFPYPHPLGYDNILDSSAPIDPIFPWRLDERVTPPDWW